jgi:hypothetical protein
VNHRRLLRFARVMWAAPLAAASFVLLAFLFLRAEIFVAAGLVLLVVGGLCLTAGVIAVIAILATRNTFAESPRRYYKKKALAVLGLLLLNLPVALAYTVIGSAQIEPRAASVAPSPHGTHLAEVIYLDERDEPGYGVAVTLRPTPGWFRRPARTVVFSGYCLGEPQLDWQREQQLRITCVGAEQVKRRVTRYRGIELTYRLPAVERAPRRTPSR